MGMTLKCQIGSSGDVVEGRSSQRQCRVGVWQSPHLSLRTQRSNLREVGRLPTRYIRFAQYDTVVSDCHVAALLAKTDRAEMAQRFWIASSGEVMGELLAKTM